MALLVLLESLSPEQRAVLLLHDVFGYGYDEVATIVGKGEANVRQLAVRARRHVEDRRPRFTTTPEQQSELARRFFTAARTGDLAGLESLLAHDVELVGDGGGKAPSLARSQRGRSRVAHTLTNWLRALRRLPEMEIRLTEVNGDPGAMFLVEGRLLAVWALDVRDGQVAGVRAVVNPDNSSTSGRSATPTPSSVDSAGRGPATELGGRHHLSLSPARPSRSRLSVAGRRRPTRPPR